MAIYRNLPFGFDMYGRGILLYMQWSFFLSSNAFANLMMKVPPCFQNSIFQKSLGQHSLCSTSVYCRFYLKAAREVKIIGIYDVANGLPY